MSRARKLLFVFLWLVVATHIYALIWSNHLDSFPQLPEKLGLWIADLTGTANSEDIEQLTVYYMLIVSFVVVSVATFVGTFIFWIFRKVLRSR